jgi:hypothetical protein
MRFLTVLLTLVFVSGCATSVPNAQNFPISSQKKALMAQHWNFIAEDAATRTLWALGKNGLAKSPIYVADASSFEFDKAFKKYMIAHLIENGASVSTIPEGAIELKYDTQVISHGSAIDYELNGYQPGMAIAGVASYWVLRDVFKSLSHSNRYTGAATAGVFDGYKALNPSETSVELIVSTSITQNNRYLMLNADSYYIEKGEEILFEGCKGNRRRCR